MLIGSNIVSILSGIDTGVHQLIALRDISVASSFDICRVGMLSVSLYGFAELNDSLAEIELIFYGKSTIHGRDYDARDLLVHLSQGSQKLSALTPWLRFHARLVHLIAPYPLDLPTMVHTR